MFRNLISTRFRLTMGIVSIVMTLLFAGARLIPSASEEAMNGRTDVANAIALASTSHVNRNDYKGLERMLEAIVARNEQLLSVGIRNQADRLVVQVGEHKGNWVDSAEVPLDRQIQVPVKRNGIDIASVEMRFRPIFQPGLAGLMAHPWVRLCGFVGAGAFLSIAFYLSLMLRQLDPRKSVPNRVREALDNLTEGLLLLNHRGRVVLANNSFLEIVGQNNEKVLGTTPSRLRWFDEQNNRCQSYPWDETFETGQTVLNRIMRLEQEGCESATFKVNCTAVGQNEKPDGVMVCFENVTQLDQAKIEVQKSRDAADAANRAKSQFLANMSHEIRTPMNAIMGFTDLLQRGMANSREEQSEYLSTIQSSGSHLLELINDILDLSKIEAGKLEVEVCECDTFELFTEVVNILGVRAREKNINLTFENRSLLPETIKTDPVRLRQVLTNLVGNAIKFTHSGGVKISANMLDSGSRPQLHIDIIDTGIGLSPEQLEKVFDPFTQADTSVTRRFGGTGLGLSISQRIVKALGGELTARSIVGQGSVFSFMIDVGSLANVSMIDEAKHKKPVRKTDANRTSSHYRLDGKRVLVVDDGEANRRLIRLFLSRAGCHVEQAENGQVAVDMVQETDLDLILMDMQMPVLDGYEATRQIRELGYKNPVIALTANAMSGDEEKCLNAGCSGFLSKPVNMDKLIQTIAEAMGIEPEPVTTESHPTEGNPGSRASSESNDQRITKPETDRPDATPANPKAPLASHDNEFSEVLKIGLEAMAAARMSNDPGSFHRVVEELREAAVVFGRLRTADSLKRLATAALKGDEAAIQKHLARFEYVVMKELDENFHGSFRDTWNTTSSNSRSVAFCSRRIQSRLPMDEPEFREIVVEFVATLENKISQMKSCYSEQNFAELARLAHWLKGAGGTVGFDEFYQPSIDLEKAAQAANPELAKSSIVEIDLLWQSIEIPDVTAATAAEGKNGHVNA